MAQQVADQIHQAQNGVGLQMIFNGPIKKNGKIRGKLLIPQPQNVVERHFWKREKPIGRIPHGNECTSQGISGRSESLGVVSIA